MLDLRSVGYLSSAGLRVVMVAKKGMDAANGKLVLRGVRKDVMHVFAMTGFTRFLAFE